MLRSAPHWPSSGCRLQYMEGTVYVGTYVGGSGKDEVFSGANLAVARMNLQQLKNSTSSHIAYHNTLNEEVAVMEVNSYGDCAISPNGDGTSTSSCDYDYPLHLASNGWVKVQSPYLLIGNSDPQFSSDLSLDPYNGALLLNSSGIEQTTADEELVLYSTHGSALNGGVALEGAYRVRMLNTYCVLWI